MNVLLIVFLTLLNGAFAMSELAMTASRKVRLMAMAEAGDKGAKAALKLAEEPTRMLSTVQVGITLTMMINSIVGEAAFSGDLAVWLLQWGMSETVAKPLATALVVSSLAFFTLIFGEMAPKRIGLLFPEAVARVTAIPMTWMATATSPFIFLISWCTEAVLRLLRVNTKHARLVTEEEISASLDEGMDAGVIEKHERRMVENVFHLDDRPLTSLMLPRSAIDWFDAQDTIEVALEKISRSLDGNDKVHSWYPVCRDDLDHVLGIVSLAQLLLHPYREVRLDALMHAPVFVPETLSGMELLEQFRQRSGRMVFVVDEYGVLQGLLTPRDMLEAITGELQPDSQAQAWATQMPDGDWQLDGSMPLAELKSRLEIDDDLPDEDKGLYNTLAGLLMAQSGRLMQVGESVACAGWRFDVLELDGRRVAQVHAQRLA